MTKANEPKAHFGIRISEELRLSIQAACNVYQVSATELVTRYIENRLQSEGFMSKEKETT